MRVIETTVDQFKAATEGFDFKSQYLEAGFKDLSRYVGPKENIYRKMEACGLGVCLVLQDNEGKTAGFCAAALVYNTYENTAFLTQEVLFVAHAYRHRGFKLILDKLKEIAKERGYTGVMLTALTDSPLDKTLSRRYKPYSKAYLME